MAHERRARFRYWTFIAALALLVLSIAMGFISEEVGAWTDLGRLSILFVLGVAWWNNETQVGL